MVVTQVQTEPPLLSGPVIEAARENALKKYWRTAGGGSLMVSLLIHAALLIGAVFMVQTIVHEKTVDFLPGGGSKASAEASQTMAQQVQTKKRNSFQRKMPVQRLTSNSETASIRLPDMEADVVDVPQATSLLSAGGSMGSGGFGSVGAGGGLGGGVGIGNLKGTVSFFGLSSPLERVIFVLDYSGSMKPNQLELVSNEMEKTLKLLPPRAEYQVIMFGGGAKFADNSWKVENINWKEDDKKRPENVMFECIVTHRPSRKVFRFYADAKRNFLFEGDESELPSDRWLSANRNNIMRTMSELRKTDPWNGTHWAWGFKTALNMRPAPKAVYFMTDGLGGNNVKEILKYNKEITKSNAQINTLLMHTSAGANLMSDLAKATGGKFTIVFNDGNTVDGETYFKDKAKYDAMLKEPAKK